MRLLSKLADIRSGLNSGLKPDLHPQMPFLWEDGRNVRFTKGGVAKMLGWTSEKVHLVVTGNATMPRGGIAYIDGATEEFHFGNDTRIYTWDGTTLAPDAKAFTGVDKLWSFENWGSWVVATNGIDAPVIYKGASYADLTGTPPATAEIMLVNGAHMLAFNTDLDAKGYEWCHEDDIEDWVPTAANAAGSNLIREFTAEIVAAVPLGDNTAVYAGEKMAVVSSLGAPFYFGHKIAFQKGISVYNKKCVASVGDLNIGLGANGFFLTDGVSITQLGEGEIADTWRRDVNPATYGKINSYHNSFTKEVIWYYASGTATEPDKAIAYNYETNTLTFQDHGRLMAIGSETTETSSLFSKPLAIEKATDVLDAWEIFKHNNGTDADTSAMVVYIESKPYAIEDPDPRNPQTFEDFIKYVEAIKLYMGIFVSKGIKIKIGVKDSLDDETYFGEVTQLADPTIPIFPDISGRWIILRVESSELGDDWELQGFAVHGSMTGGPPL